MAKIKITENELKQLIRESVEGVLEEATPNTWNGPVQIPGTAPTPGNTTRVPYATPNQMADRERENYEFNQGANTSLQRWNNLGAVGQLKVIQQLAGIPAAQCDGKLGPQTLGTIFMKLANGQQVSTPQGIIYPQYLGKTKWNYGKPGTYTNR